MWLAFAAPLIPGTVTGGPPIPFGGWSVNNGNITASCASGVVCGPAMSTRGMLQRELTAGADNGRYIQNILTDSTASGLPGTVAFSSESFVKQGWSTSSWTNTGGENGESTITTGTGDTSSGLSSLQVVRDSSGDSMLVTSKINTGWAAEAGKPSIEISQNVGGSLTSSSVDMAADFSYIANMDASGNRTGFKLDLAQTVNGSAFDGGGGGRGWSGGGSINKMVMRERAGDMLTSSGSASLSGGSGGGGRGGFGGGRGGFGGGGWSSGTSSGSGGSISWSAGNDIKVTWIAQSGFGFQAYDNLSDSRDRIATSSISGTGPFTWYDPPFGPKPSYSSGGSSGGGGGGWGW